MSKHLLILKVSEVLSRVVITDGVHVQDASLDEILEFLEKAEQAGQHIPAVIAPHTDLSANNNGTDDSNNNGVITIAYEARQLKSLFLKLYNS